MEGRRKSINNISLRKEDKQLDINEAYNMKNAEDVHNHHLVIGEDDDNDDLHNALQRARKVADLNKQPIDLFASSSITKKKNSKEAGSRGNTTVLTEIEEFVTRHRLLHPLFCHREAQNRDAKDIFAEKDAPSDRQLKRKDGSKDISIVQDEKMAEVDEIKPPPIHENTLGKGLSGALGLLRDRGTLKDTVEWGGRKTDRKKSTLVNDNDNKKEIRIERTDEYGRTLTPKEAFRRFSHGFHGKGPGKTKQEKRKRQYHEELKAKQLNNSDTPPLSVERMREAQSKNKTPYLVLN